MFNFDRSDRSDRSRLESFPSFPRSFRREERLELVLALWRWTPTAVGMPFLVSPWVAHQTEWTLQGPIRWALIKMCRPDLYMYYKARTRIRKEIGNLTYFSQNWLYWWITTLFVQAAVAAAAAAVAAASNMMHELRTSSGTSSGHHGDHQGQQHQTHHQLHSLHQQQVLHDLSKLQNEVEVRILKLLPILLLAKAKILLKFSYMVGICKLEVMGTITW